MTRTMMLAMLAGTLIPSALARAQIQWASPISSNWNNAANWNPMNVPNLAGESALIGIAGTYTVTLDISPSIDELDITNPNATLAHPGGLVMIIGGGTSTNNGLYRLNSNSSGVATELRFAADATLNGTGTLRLLFSGDGAILGTSPGATLTQGAGHTITGFGHIIAAMVNEGAVVADTSGQTITLDVNPKTNHGLFKAAGPGTLVFSGISIAQNPGAAIVADGGTVRFVGTCTVSDGTLQNINAGILRNEGTLSLTGVGLSGTLDLFGGTLTNIVGPGGLSHTGPINLNANGSGVFTELRFNTTSTLGGSGTLRLLFPGDGAVLTTSAGQTITNGAGHTVSGMGHITAALVNDGNLIADIDAQSILLDGNAKTNHALMRATGGGTLAISNIAVTQSPAGSLLSDAGSVLFGGTTSLTGGALTSLNNGLLRNDGTLTLTDVALGGKLDLKAGTTTIVAGPGGLTHTGPINLNSNGAGVFTELRFTDTSTLGGSGTLRLLFPGDGAILTTAPGQTVTNGAAHTIAGTGRITAALVNNGDLVADVAAQAISLDGNPKTNNALMKATGGGTLAISNIAVTQSPAGSLLSDAGSIIFGGTTSLTGGALTSVNNGLLRNDGNLTLTDVALADKLDLSVGTTTIVAGPGGLVHTGPINLNSNGVGAYTELRFTDTSTLGGNGTLRLLFPGDGAIVTTAAGQTVTNGTAHTIVGTGRITAALVNNGDIIADVPAQAISLDGNPKANNALMKATGAGTLVISNIPVTQSPAGSLLSDAGSIIFGGTTSLTGGALTGLNDGLLRNDGNLTLTDVALAGKLDLSVGTTTIVAGPGGLVHTGPINLNSSGVGAYTELRFTDTSTLGGNGSLRLLFPGDGAIVTTAAGQTVTNGAGHTIRGNGRFNGTVVNAGRVAPGIDAGGVGAIDLAGSFAQASGGVTEVELGGTASSLYDQLTGNAAVSLDGTLEVALVGGFSPPTNTGYTVVSGASVTGEFSALVAPGLPSGRRWGVVYTPTSAILRVVCYPDCNNDFAMNINDFICFQTKFALGDPYADCDGNGTRNINDFICFQTKFALGCP